MSNLTSPLNSHVAQHSLIPLQQTTTGPRQSVFAGKHVAHTSFTRRAACNITTKATRKPAEAIEEWGALAAAEDDIIDEMDPDFVEYVNDVANKALRVMLKEDDIQRTLQLKDELNQLGALFVKQKNINAAKFVFALICMLGHKLPTEVDLQGPYQVGG